MGHAVLTLKNAAYLGGATSFLLWVTSCHSGPWESKYQVPPKIKERYMDVPMWANDFRPDTHPAITREYND